jgi:hypothetical protein
MRWLLKRWWFWTGLVLFLGLAGSVLLIYPSRNRITQENFDRIQEGMSLDEVEELIGKDDGRPYQSKLAPVLYFHHWEQGQNEINVVFHHGKVCKVYQKAARFASLRETLQRYAKKGAERIGINWP